MSEDEAENANAEPGREFVFMILHVISDVNLEPKWLRSEQD